MEVVIRYSGQRIFVKMKIRHGKRYLVESVEIARNHNEKVTNF